MKISGEYSKPKSQPARYCSAYLTTDRAPSTASVRHSSRPTPNTTRRNSGAVALYRCTVARGAPASDCTVRSMSSSRAWVSTEICTSPGMTSSVDQAADEVEVGLARRREPDLDLLVAHPHQQVEHGALAGRAHRVDQRLVAVAQVGGQPARRGGDRLAGPGPVRQAYGRNGGVAVAGHTAGDCVLYSHWLAGLLPRLGRVADAASQPRGEGAGRYRASPRQLRSSSPRSIVKRLSDSGDQPARPAPPAAAAGAARAGSARPVAPPEPGFRAGQEPAVWPRPTPRWRPARSA